MNRNGMILEAALSRSHKALDLMFPGIQLTISEMPQFCRVYIEVRYNHPKLGMLGWNVAVDPHMLDRADGYVEYLLKDIPLGFARALTEKAMEYAGQNRYSFGG